jgi:hypothetical protein
MVLPEPVAVQGSMAPVAQPQAVLEASLSDRQTYRAVEDERFARTMSTAAAECTQRS